MTSAVSVGLRIRPRRSTPKIPTVLVVSPSGTIVQVKTHASPGDEISWFPVLPDWYSSGWHVSSRRRTRNSALSPVLVTVTV